jgi:chromosomal replication initiation ATPase DnaA
MRRGEDRQLPLRLPHLPAFGATDFLVGSSNRAAFEIVHRWPNWPSRILWIWGAAGSGKTHLLQSWRERSGAVLLEAPALSGDADVASLHRSGALAIEAIDEAGSERTLFHVINSAPERGAAILMTSRRAPAAWQPSLPDLASRLRAAQTIEIGRPEDDLLRRLLVKLFADRQIVVEPSVLEFMLRHMERSFAAAALLVERLDLLTLARGGKVTRGLAAAVLRDGDGSAHPDDHR